MLCTEKVFLFFVAVRMYRQQKCKLWRGAWGIKDRSDPELFWGRGRDAGRTAAPWRVCTVLLPTRPRAPRVLCGILTPYPCGTHSQRQEARPGSRWLSDQGARAVPAVSSSAQTVIENGGSGVNAHWLIFCFLLKWNLYRKKTHNSEHSSSTFIKLVNMCSLLFRNTDGLTRLLSSSASGN